MQVQISPELVKHLEKLIRRGAGGPLLQFLNDETLSFSAHPAAWAQVRIPVSTGALWWKKDLGKIGPLQLSVIANAFASAYLLAENVFRPEIWVKIDHSAKAAIYADLVAALSLLQIKLSVAEGRRSNSQDISIFGRALVAYYLKAETFDYFESRVERLEKDLKGRLGALTRGAVAALRVELEWKEMDDWIKAPETSGRVSRI